MRVRATQMVKAAPLVVLALACLRVTQVKVEQFRGKPLYSPDTDRGFFVAEGAFQYRYVKLVAAGRDIPALDRRAQWPEGVDTRRELTVMMERVVGLSYRALSRVWPDLKLHVYTIWFISLFTSVAIVAVYLAARLLTFSPWVATCVATLYAFTPASFDRVLFFEYEYFALPLIFLAFALFLKGLRPGGRAALWQCLSGGAMAWALCSWHGASFYLWGFLVACWAVFVVCPAEARPSFARAFWVWLGWVVLAACLCPAMRHAGLWRAPQVLWADALGLALLTESRRPGRHRWNGAWLAASVGAVALLYLLFEARGHTYGHVWPLMQAKLRHFGVKPDDPAQLTFAARVLWYEGLETMSRRYLIAGFVFLPLGAGLGVAALLRRGVKALTAPDLLVVVQAVLFAVLALLFFRLRVYAVFFLALLAGYAWRLAPRPGPDGTGLRPRRRLAAALVLALVVHARCATEPVSGMVRRGVGVLFPAVDEATVFRTAVDQTELLAWIEANTAPDAVFMTNFELAATILNDTGRPINLQPKYESAHMRDKFREWLLCLFEADEAGFYRLARRYEADYFVLCASTVLDRGKYSYRYFADRLQLPRASLPYRFHFRPDGLRHFAPLFRNRFFTVFRVLREGAEPERRALERFPFYDETLFASSGGATESRCFDDTRVAEVSERVYWAWRELRAAARAAQRPGGVPKAAEHAWRAVTQGLPSGRQLAAAAAVLHLAGRHEQAELCLARAGRQSGTVQP